MDYITIQELSRQTNIPERTLRRYIDRHARFFIFRRESGQLLVSSDAIATVTMIREAYESGATAARVDDAMTSQGLPVTIDVTGTGQAVTMTMAEALQELGKAMAVPLAAVTERQIEMMELLNALQSELRTEQEKSTALREELAAVRTYLLDIRNNVHEVATAREPDHRAKENAKERAEILRELKATREALATAEARGRRQEQRMDEIAEYVRPKQQPEKRRGWWPFGRR